MDGKNDNINQMELLFKISNDVASIMSDLRNFQDNYNSDKKDTAERIEDVRKDCEKEVKAMKETFSQFTFLLGAAFSNDDQALSSII